MKRFFKKIINWWTQNATKRWLLTLDRLCICYMFTMIWMVARDVANSPSGDFGLLDLALVGVFLMFIVLYTPAYMFPGSDASVDLFGRHGLDDRGVTDKEKEP